MKSMTMLLALVALLSAAPAFAVPAALAPYMSVDEYREAGFDRLTPAERARVAELFRRAAGDGADGPIVSARPAPPPTPAADTPAPAPTPRDTAPDVDDPRLFGFGSFGGDASSVEARLDGTFTGWRAGTRFRLENGQVWEATAGDAFRPVQPVDRPVVTIRRMAFGSFLLRVDGYNASVRVRRIE